MEKYIVYRIIDGINMQIEIIVTGYTDELYAELQKDEIGVYLLEVEEDFDDAMTTARVFARAYRELFYRNYEVQISVESNGKE